MRVWGKNKGLPVLVPRPLPGTALCLKADCFHHRLMTLQRQDPHLEVVIAAMSATSEEVGAA